MRGTIPRREQAVFTFGRAGIPLLRRNRNDYEGQNPNLPHCNTDARFNLNKQTPTARVQCDAMCQNLTYALQQMTMQNDAFANCSR